MSIFWVLRVRQHEDYDGDGLTNLQEVEYGTDLTLKDTDNDGLTDYEEIFVYGTDPLNPDTDGDGINDGDEIKLGLDPLSADSDNDGVPDNEEIIAQTVENSDLDAINSDNAYKLTIDINAAGYANNAATVKDSGFSYITSTNPSVLGKVVAIDYAENLKVDSAVLKFEIPRATVNSARNYPDCTELEGLNRYAIFHYSKEYNIMYPVNAEYDESSSTLKVNTNELGDYFVVDLDKWFYEMGIVPDQYEHENGISALSLDYDEEICYTDSEEAEEKYTIEELEEIFDFSQPFGSTEIEANEQSEAVSAVFAAPRRSASSYADKTKIEPVDVVFIIDCTDNLKSNFENVKANVISASKDIFDICDSARICVIQFWASKTPEKSSWYSNSQADLLESYVNSIEKLDYIGNSLHGAAMTMAADLDYRSDVKRFNFLIFDEYSQWSEDMTGEMIENGIQHIINKDINFSILYDHSRTELSNNSQNLITLTKGYDGSNLGSFFVDVVSHIFDYTDDVGGSEIKPDIPSNYSYVDISGDVILGDFSQKCVYTQTTYDGEELENIIIKEDKKSDYDKDGLADSDEVDWKGLKQNGKEYICRTYGEWRMLIEMASTADISYTLLNAKVLSILSNPWESDSDFDDIADGPLDVLGNGKTEDENPLNATYITQGYKTPWYIPVAIIFSNLLNENKNLSGESVWSFDYDDKESDAHYVSGIYTQVIWGQALLFYSEFQIRYYDEEKSKTILRNYTKSSQTADLILSFLDGISEPLGHPDMNLPSIPSFIVSLFGLLRSEGYINYDAEASARVIDFCQLYGVADGKTPLCVNATLYQLGVYDHEWYQTASYYRGYPYRG